MNINLFNGLATTIFGSTLLGYLSLSIADAPSPLDVNQHPGSPPYESLFPDRVVPLDAELSWTRRFQGDESFNPDETLPPTSPVIDQSSIHSKPLDEGESSSGFDTTGVVKQIKLSEGKVKIEHGPIDRLGMPGMTMMFRVEEPDLLMGIEKGAEVAFNVDNTSAGFAITRLEVSSSNFDTTGIVKQIKSADGKVKIEHGPIDRLGMPGMTMMFRVEDVNQLQGLEKGAEVAFNVANTAAGFSITRLEIVDQKSASRFDASGTVKSIRTSQGKVKIEHGPIERLGMPGMTMLFKVKNQAELNALETDMQVDFNVENGPGGFEITAIRPRQAEAFMPGSSATSTQLCYSIGPFKNRASAVEVSSRYQARGSTAKIISRVDQAYIGEMVFIDDLGTREAALEVANKLKSQGITDSMLLNEPGKTNALSLGVYGLKQNADRLKAKVESMDLAVKTEARYRREAMYWLRNRQINAEQPLLLLSADELESGVRQVSSNCNSEEDA